MIFLKMFQPLILYFLSHMTVHLAMLFIMKSCDLTTSKRTIESVISGISSRQKEESRRRNTETGKCFGRRDTVNLNVIMILHASQTC